ncbi:hypothetical protein ANACOL_00780 [Anaerotruncus colihominis DSM 17241]|uniref:Uncharacterized protein n=1 Tax=Anaerotruncus colihominis DSM 17241 TaxID=445972 RepID=B0P7P5_9FIRM|nr:hypothetical protein ANACOL_00780 [Anaerotruncus colihominis DSM 17241]
MKHQNCRLFSENRGEYCLRKNPAIPLLQTNPNWKPALMIKRPGMAA